MVVTLVRSVVHLCCCLRRADDLLLFFLLLAVHRLYHRRRCCQNRESRLHHLLVECKCSGSVVAGADEPTPTPVRVAPVALPGLDVLFPPTASAALRSASATRRSSTAACRSLSAVCRAASAAAARRSASCRRSSCSSAAIRDSLTATALTIGMSSAMVAALALPPALADAPVVAAPGEGEGKRASLTWSLYVTPPSRGCGCPCFGDEVPPYGSGRFELLEPCCC
jgi:hypothetical protein